MIDLSDYVLSELVCEDGGLMVYRGCRCRDRLPVIIKAIEKGSSGSMGIIKLMHEYEICQNLDLKGVVKPIGLEQDGTYMILVLEGVGTVSLRNYIQCQSGQSVNLYNFLEIAILLTEILGQLHESGIYHRDLKPENIFIDTSQAKVYITGFGSAVLYTVEDRKQLHNLNTSGTPEYMAPELTGRLNIGADHRSDLYSLGVIFYEILTHRLPLEADNHTELIYAHISKKPLPPDRVDPAIPMVISHIIMKLLEKSAEERYQSAYGLLWDLKECQGRLMEMGCIDSFSIGRWDSLACCRLPHTLYGRDEERLVLEDAFKRACEGKGETIFVSGCPGIGKTMLVNEVIRSVVLEKGYFITGKFDQLAQNKPYASFATAFGDLTRHLMTESREELLRWKKRIMNALGRRGSVVTEVIPELEHIIGKQPPVDGLPPKEAENRFFMVFRDFIGIFARKGRPLVLFLDDLQWADYSSLRLLKYLVMNADIPYMLIIGAYRENEVDDGHPLTKILKEINHKQHVSLMPMNFEQTMEYIADAIHTKKERTAALSAVLHRKTGGNPFFLGQLLMLIHNEKLLYFDIQAGRWKWKLRALKKMEPGEDVLEILLRKIRRLPEDTCEVLKLAACIGNRFDLETLASVYCRSLEATASCLMPSVHYGLIVTAMPQEANIPLKYSNMNSSAYEFMHDRVRQAVYSLIPEDKKKERHLAIGRLLLQNLQLENLEDKILPVMDHFNRSLELVQDPQERMKLADYNLLAGQKAKSLSAYASALQYFRAGKALLSDDAWDNAYTLCFNLHLELAQAEYLSANVEAAEKYFDIVIEKAGTELERSGVYGLKVILYAGMGEYDKAVRTGIRTLENLGVKVPIHPTRLDYARELLMFKWYMRSREIEDLVDLPEMRDPIQRKISELLIRLSSVTMLNYPDLYGYIALKSGNYAVSHGNAEMSSAGYFGYSMTSICVLGDYKAGSRYGRVCIQLADKYDRSSSKCIMYFVYGAFISHLTSHASDSIGYFEKAVNMGMEAGDVLIIGFAHCLLIETRYFLGIPLERIEEEIREKRNIGIRLKHDSLYVNTIIYEKVISALRGRKSDSLALGAAEFLKDDYFQLAQKDQASLATLYICQMQLCYMSGNYSDALYAAQKIEALLDAIRGLLIGYEYYYYCSLTIAAIYKELPPREKKRWFKILNKNRKILKKLAEACRANYEHMYLLVTAETERILYRGEGAMSLYDRAVESARKEGYIQNEALAGELAAKFYLSRGLRRIAKTYMLDACNGYHRWGADSKVKELQNRYPELLGGVEFGAERNDTESFENIGRVTASNLDEIAYTTDTYYINRALENVGKATDISSLLKGFLDAAVPIIGADRGCLILEKGGELFIEAVKDSNSGETVVRTIPLKDARKISKSVVRYVARTLETIVLNYEEGTGIFEKDPYIAESSPKSIACLPLFFQGVPFGVIYFENRYISGVFADNRLESLQLLSTHIVYAKKLQSYLEEDNVETMGEAQTYLIDPLTERETEVLQLIAGGMSNKEIADSLGITINTVKGYIKNIYEKLGANRRVQAVSRAKELNILNK